MKVKFLQKWFCKDAPYDSHGRVFIGRLYRKGIHDLPDFMYEDLPKKPDGELVDWIQVLDGEPVIKKEEEINTLTALAKKNEAMDRLQKQYDNLMSSDSRTAKMRAGKIKKQMAELEE